MAGKTILWIALLIPVCWLFGVHVSDPVRVIIFITVVALLFPKFRHLLLNFKTLSQFQSRLLLIFIIIYPVLICAQHLIRVYAGSQSINFAYRSQVIDNVVNQGGLYSSILSSDFSLQNWLTHHFNPVLVIPGLLGFIGVPAYLSQIIFLMIILSIVAVVIYKILLLRNYSREVIFIPIVIFFSIYSVRHPLTFGIEDEFFALPFIALAFLYLFKHNFGISCLFILLTFTVKESFFLLGISWGALGIMLYYKDMLQLSKTDIYYSIALIILGATFFVLYIFGHEILFGKVYEHLHKAGGLDSLFDSEIIFDKLYHFVLLFFPFLFFPFIYRKCLILLIPAIPFILLMFYSNYMYQATDYYAVIPSFVIFISCVYFLPEKDNRVLKSVRPGILILILSIAFIHGTWKPAKILAEADSGTFSYRSDVESAGIYINSKDDKVLVSLSLAPLSTMFKKLSVIIDESKISNRDFDFVLIKKDDADELKNDLEKYTAPIDTLGHNMNILLFERKQH